ncbi:MAG: energy transducer TonB [Longimicrobiaceae bacterium]
MFKVVVERRKRSIWSPRTVAISVGAHLLVLTGVVIATANARPIDKVGPIVEIGQPPEQKEPPAKVKPTQPPPPPDQPVPVKGQTLQIEAPEKVPESVRPPNPNEVAVDPREFTGEGRIGDVIAPPDPGPPQPPTGPAPLPDFRTNDPIDAKDADQLPELLSPREAQRMLERVYPHMLRDAGVTGHTTVTMVIDRDGRVEPGSVTVQETTHDAFREAAVRAAERFRFRPAKLRGQPIAVSIAIPIDWQIQN